MSNGLLLPGPADAPIDKLFRMPGAAWMLFAFGVTFAPFFEELVFRGFLLPALCTAYDWAAENTTAQRAAPARRATAIRSGRCPPCSSLRSSPAFSSRCMHAEQTGYSLGPFLLLICVSLVLCGIASAPRSLAASVLVHASYNFLLFSFMLLGTSGFRHLEKM